MAGTSLDMTAPRPHGASPVYAVYGAPDPTTLTMAAMRNAGTALVQVPVDVLVALETGRPALRDEALTQVARHRGMDFVGAVGFDDWWTTALAALNPGFALATARIMVTNKALLYRRLRECRVSTADFLVGSLSTRFLADALEHLGPRPVLKPTTGAGSRGVYRYRADLSIADNLALYQQLLQVGHIDSQIPIIAAEYLGGSDAMEISVDLVVCEGHAVHAVVHEKLSATQVHPFVDQVMTSPPLHPDISAALPYLTPVLVGIIATVAITDGALHIELRLHNEQWYVLDIGVRPGAGLVPHAVQARTGVDPRRAHLGACIGRPLTAAALSRAVPVCGATCIACCYVSSGRRPLVSLLRQSELADQLRREPAVFGWHLNVSEIDDDVFHSDAGLSIGVGASNPGTALRQLRSLTEPYTYSID